MHAHANMSDLGPGFDWVSCSGAMYDGVPITATVRVELRSSALAMPKSITRGPSEARSTFDGLKSRCTMPAWWMATSAVMVPMASRCREVPVRGPCSRTTSARVGPSMYSLTMYGRPPYRPVSTTCAVQNGATRRAIATSRTNRSDASASPARSARSSLSATFVPSGAVAR